MPEVDWQIVGPVLGAVALALGALYGMRRWWQSRRIELIDEFEEQHHFEPAAKDLSADFLALAARVKTLEQRPPARDHATEIRDLQTGLGKACEHLDGLEGRIRELSLARPEIKQAPPVKPAPLLAPTLPRAYQPPRRDKTLQSIVQENFDAVDMRTNRHFSQFVTEFKRLLGPLAAKIIEQDDAVLFFKDPKTALVVPWSNTKLHTRWQDFFSVSTGSYSKPVQSVSKFALVELRDDGAFDLREKGNVEND